MPQTKSKKLELEKELTKELKALASEIKKIKSMDYLKVFNNPFKFMWFAFLKGLMVGFGSVLGASVLVGVFIFLLGQVSFVPIIGDFVEEIISQIQLEKVIPQEFNNHN